MPNHNGLISAYLLDRKGGGKVITWDDINHWKPQQGLLWIHLNYTKNNSIQWLNQNSGLDKLILKTMTMVETRPRSVITSNGILTVLRGINFNPGHDPEDMVSIRIWLDEHRMITTLNRNLLSIEHLRKDIEENNGPKTTIDFLIILNNHIINHMSDVFDDIEEQVDQLEEEVLTAESHLLRSKIADVRRQSVSIRRYLAPQREALNRLYIEPCPLVTELDRMHFREATDRIVHYIENLDSARERAAVTHEELSSRLTEQLDNRMYVLSLVAIIFLPLSFITGLLGINVAGIPGATYKWAFWVVCFLLGGISAVMLYFFYKKKWITY